MRSLPFIAVDIDEIRVQCCSYLEPLTDLLGRVPRDLGVADEQIAGVVEHL